MMSVALTAPVRSYDQLVGRSFAAALVRPPGRVFSRVALRLPARYAHWVLVARTADDRYLLIQFAYGGCDPLASVRIEARNDEVAVIPVLGLVPPGPCAANFGLKLVAVDLMAPLGQRHLLDPSDLP